MDHDQPDVEEEELLIPPDNFCMVEPGIYRSGFPGKKHFPFLKTLNLRTILYLCPEEYPENNLTFLTQHHVQLLQYGVSGNKEPFLEMPHGIISEALVQLLDARNHPLLIHCNKGKHRTGCLVGVLHKAMGWSLSAIFEEYRVFSRPKERFVDQQFIECWEMSLPPTHSERSGEMAAAAAAGISTDGAANAEDRLVVAGASVPVPDDKAAYLVNPEANEHLHRRGREKEMKAAAAAAAAAASAAARDPPATTSHASLLHRPAHGSTVLVAAPGGLPASGGAAAAAALARFRHHQHAQSQPNLSFYAPP